jgi:hypothetical protein
MHTPETIIPLRSYTFPAPVSREDSTFPLDKTTIVEVFEKEGVKMVRHKFKRIPHTFCVSIEEFCKLANLALVISNEPAA